MLKGKKFDAAEKYFMEKEVKCRKLVLENPCLPLLVFAGEECRR